MNKIIIKSGLFLLLTGLLLVFLLRSRSPFGRNNSSFAAEPKEEITKIELSENGNKLVLEKKGESWLINGKTEARKSGVLLFLRILKEIRIKSPVSSELFHSIITDENVHPVIVKVYEKRSLLKNFLVYKTRSNIYGNIMRISKASKSFIVYVPGYEVDVGSGFTSNELFWQPYVVFNLLPSEIASVELENYSDTSSSFSIINRDHHYFLYGNAGKLTAWDSSRVVRYLSYFARVPFESWAGNASETERKIIQSKHPSYRITVRSATGINSVLTLWGMVRSENDTLSIDSDRLLGKTDERDDLFILRYFDIDPILKKRSYFFKE